MPRGSDFQIAPYNTAQQFDRFIEKAVKAPDVAHGTRGDYELLYTRDENGGSGGSLDFKKRLPSSKTISEWWARRRQRKQTRNEITRLIDESLGKDFAGVRSWGSTKSIGARLVSDLAPQGIFSVTKIDDEALRKIARTVHALRQEISLHKAGAPSQNGVSGTGLLDASINRRQHTTLTLSADKLKTLYSRAAELGPIPEGGRPHDPLPEEDSLLDIKSDDASEEMRTPEMPEMEQQDKTPSPPLIGPDPRNQDMAVIEETENDNWSDNETDQDIAVTVNRERSTIEDAPSAQAQLEAVSKALLNAAAKAGPGGVEYALAQLYRTGADGVEQDFDKAAYWLVIAEQKGNQDAKEALTLLAESQLPPVNNMADHPPEEIAAFTDNENRFLQIGLYRAFHNGADGVLPDDKAAAAWLVRGGDHDNIDFNKYVRKSPSWRVYYKIRNHERDHGAPQMRLAMAKAHLEEKKEGVRNEYAALKILRALEKVGDRDLSFQCAVNYPSIYHLERNDLYPSLTFDKIAVSLRPYADEGNLEAMFQLGSFLCHEHKSLLDFETCIATKAEKDADLHRSNPHFNLEDYDEEWVSENKAEWAAKWRRDAAKKAPNQVDGAIWLLRAAREGHKGAIAEIKAIQQAIGRPDDDPALRFVFRELLQNGFEETASEPDECDFLEPEFDPLRAAGITAKDFGYVPDSPELFQALMMLGTLFYKLDHDHYRIAHPHSQRALALEPKPLSNERWHGRIGEPYVYRDNYYPYLCDTDVGQYSNGHDRLEPLQPAADYFVRAILQRPEQFECNEDGRRYNQLDDRLLECTWSDPSGKIGSEIGQALEDKCHVKTKYTYRPNFYGDKQTLDFGKDGSTYFGVAADSGNVQGLKYEMERNLKRAALGNPAPNRWHTYQELAMRDLAICANAGDDEARHRLDQIALHGPTGLQMALAKTCLNREFRLFIRDQARQQYLGRGSRSEQAYWYHRAALRGDQEGQYQYALAVQKGGAQDKGGGPYTMWMSRAAEQGHADAQYQLAVFYQDRRDTPHGAAAFAKWVNRAAAQGHEAAQALLQSAGNLVHTAPARLPDAAKPDWWDVAEKLVDDETHQLTALSVLQRQRSVLALDPAPAGGIDNRPLKPEGNDVDIADQSISTLLSISDSLLRTGAIRQDLRETFLQSRGRLAEHKDYLTALIASDDQPAGTELNNRQKTVSEILTQIDAAYKLLSDITRFKTESIPYADDTLRPIARDRGLIPRE